jgi:hypothetical protein
VRRPRVVEAKRFHLGSASGVRDQRFASTTKEPLCRSDLIVRPMQRSQHDSISQAMGRRLGTGVGSEDDPSRPRPSDASAIYPEAVVASSRDLRLATDLACSR